MLSCFPVSHGKVTCLCKNKTHFIKLSNGETSLWLSLNSTHVIFIVPQADQLHATPHWCSHLCKTSPDWVHKWTFLYCKSFFWLVSCNILIFWDTGFLIFMSCKPRSSTVKENGLKYFTCMCNESRIWRFQFFLNNWKTLPWCSIFLDLPVHHSSLEFKWFLQLSFFLSQKHSWSLVQPCSPQLAASDLTLVMCVWDHCPVGTASCTKEPIFCWWL